jgi:hypothetical protein
MKENIMEILGPLKTENPSSLILPRKNSCCSSPAPVSDAPSSCGSGEDAPSWTRGLHQSPVGPLLIVSNALTFIDLFHHFRARTSAYRMNLAVKPGLYASGNPVAESDVLVTANYKLSLDALRKNISGLDAWILVLDTAGINVWCAAGKGTFGTDELVKRISLAGLDKCVKHRRIIVPQLGAPGVSSGDVKRRTGFTVYFGPVEAADIKKYISQGYRADDRMRKVKFGVMDRLILTPMELNSIIRKLPWYLLFVMVFSGLTTEGVLFGKALTLGCPLTVAALAAIISGALITPVLLPLVPFRSFAVKGWIWGAASMAGLYFFTDIFIGLENVMLAAVMICFPLLSSYLALQFTGATTFTNISGVRREMRFALPVYIAGLAVSSVLLIIYKTMELINS